MRFFERKYGLRSTSFRISNPYGTRQNPHKRQGIIPIFLRNILNNKPLTVMGDGTMFRDYIYVKDFANIVATMISTGPSQPVYNVGSGRGTTVNELVDAMVNVTGRHPVIEYRDVPSTYVHGSVLDTTRIQNEFGPFEMTELEVGIQRTWQEICEHGF